MLVKKLKERDKAKTIQWLNVRMGITLVVFLLFYLVIIIRVSNLMLLNRDNLMALAERQHKVISTLVIKRGNIYDVRGEDLAMSVTVDSIYACPAEIKNTEKTVRLLSRSLGMSESVIMKKIKSDKNFVWIERKVAPSIVEEVKKLDLAGIGFIAEEKRFYPHKDLGCHLIGFVGTDSQGLSGIELEMEKYLRSTVSHFIAIRDASGRKLFEMDISKAPALKNYDVTMTIDIMVQFIAERELKKGIERAKASGGTVIVMDPKSGEILAMANYPAYDPNCFYAFEKSEWANKAVSMNFEPGSIFKIFLASGVLEEGLAESDDVFDCEGGSYRILDKEFHDLNGNYDTLTMSNIIKYSSNIGAIKLGLLLGKEELDKYIKNFGFSETTGVLLPGEERGIIADPKTWDKIDLATASFGQGLSVTPLQLITAVAAIANGGLLMEPHIVKKVHDRNGAVIDEASPKIRRRVLSEDTAKAVVEMMKGVVRGGTGTRAAVPGFEVAGKTSTAQVYDPALGVYSTSDYVASFVGFLPADDPKIICLVIVEKPKTDIYGGTVAATIFSEIAHDTMNYLKTFPEERLRAGERITRGVKGGTPSPFL